MDPTVTGGQVYAVVIAGNESIVDLPLRKISAIMRLSSLETCLHSLRQHGRQCTCHPAKQAVKRS
ncbi:MAG: hypothetical protein EHM41_11430 [Chloroflexi bacterium]|nr:MAG: hypothetical protein EHM41_11430 [Chloroflexota bacterium]